MSDKELIVSLTSYPARINTVPRVIETLINQTHRADKIILWLNPESFPNGERDLPAQLLDLTARGLVIGWYKNIRSYTKLIPTLLQYPDATIITVDDDILYPCDLIDTLLHTHRRHPNDICAHRIRKIAIKDGKVAPYSKWRLSECRGLFSKYRRVGHNNLLCGVGGVLYPPHSLHPDVLREDLFTELCKHQDDVWFWAMAVMNNRKIVPTRRGYNVFKRTIESAQATGLWQNVNCTESSPNNTALENCIKHYPGLKVKLGLDKA